MAEQTRTKEQIIEFIKDSPSRIALQAGIELGQIEKNKYEDIFALKLLYERLNSVCEYYRSHEDYGLFDETYKINKSFEKSKLIQAPKTIPEFFRGLEEVVSSFKKIIDNPRDFKKNNGDYIKKMKSFCLALHDSEIPILPQFDPYEPQHPFKHY